MITTGAKRSDDYNRLTLTGFPYLTLSDVEDIYWVINDRSNRGLKNFSQKAKDIAVKTTTPKAGYVYQFRDEEALFRLFQETLPLQLERREISNWGRLMQYIS